MPEGRADESYQRNAQTFMRSLDGRFRGAGRIMRCGPSSFSSLESMCAIAAFGLGGWASFGLCVANMVLYAHEED